MKLYSTPPLIMHGGAVFPWSQLLQDRYTVEDRFEEEYELFTRQGDELWLPRRLATGTPELDLRTAGIPAEYAVTFTAKHEDQARVVAESKNLITLGRSHIVQAPTGYGKTYVGCALIGHTQRRALVLTTKEDLIKQWREAARNTLGLTDDQIGEWRGDVVPQKHQPFVIGLVHSVLKGPARYPQWMFDQFGVVMADEVHRMGADTFTQAMWWLPARLRLGLSATPYRKDGKDVVFQSHIGDIEVVGEQETLIPTVIMEHTAWKCPRRIVKDKKTGRERMERVAHKPGRVMHIVKTMAVDTRRNVLVAKFVRLAYEKGRTIVVFADTMEHLKAMRVAILASGVKEKDTGWYVGLDADVYEMPRKQREAAREKAKLARVIFATYKMFSEGTDLPWLDTCVLGSPRGDVNQIVGRIRREYPDKKVPLVYDPVDMDSSVFAAYAKNRMNWYSSLGAKVNVYR